MSSARRRTGWIVAAALLAAGVTVAALWLGSAWWYYQESWGPGPLGERTAAAQTAQRLEPWNTQMRVRALWLRGESELSSGNYNAAVQTLAQAYRADIGDQPLLALFKRAQDIQALETVKKAHLQHGHEGPGGTLRPQDIER